MTHHGRAATLSIVIVWFLALAAGVPAQGLGISTPAPSTAFADYLFKNGCYQQAATEYKRVIFLTSEQGLPVATAIYQRVAESHALSGDYDSAVRWSRLGSDSLGITDGTIELVIFCARTLRRNGQNQEALVELEKTSGVDAGSEVYGRVQFERGLNHALLLDDRLAAAAFDSIVVPLAFAHRATFLRSRLRSASSLPHRNALAAGVMGVLPGFGYLYTGHHQTAIAAAAVIGLFTLAAFKSFDSGDSGAGAVCAFFGSAWYVGSIYGSYFSAQRFNDFYLERYKATFKE